MTGPQAIDSKLNKWVRECIQLGSDLEIILRDLREAGLSDDVIAAAIDANRPTLDESRAQHSPPLLKRKPPGLRRVDSPRLELFVYDGFMSTKECERVVALANHYLTPSTLAHEYHDKAFRTSTTAHLSHLKSPVATRLDEKICRTLGIRPAYAEGIQAQRYDVGQEFKAHWDWFQPDTKIYLRHAGLRGNRTWTFMVYLNDGMQGGATRFTEIDFAVQPRTGTAVLWNNMNKDGTPNQATKHCGEPVVAGHKVIITKWFRAIGEGAVFYE
jgi:prolyl 4-hydroxylase